MCGIAGTYKNGQIDAADIGAVLRMVDAQQRRGPDDWGLLVPSGALSRPGVSESLSHRNPEHILTYQSSAPVEVVLGSRRLSILDLSTAARMPMPSQARDIFITYNGEIYNYREVREELKSRGCIFRTDSDTEVILQGYKEWGDSVVHHLRGMFGFAIADMRGEMPRLLLARDRFGIKPLYYLCDGPSLLFASEYRALVGGQLLEEDLSPAALISFLQLGSIALPQTTDPRVCALSAAHSISYSVDGLRSNRYWDLTNHVAPDGQATAESLDSYARKVRPVLEGAVQSHLISDVPLGVFLSGGLDSSALVALASQSRANPLTTISVIFEELEFSERAFAKLVADRFKTDHREITLSCKDFYRDLDDMLQAMDQPTVDGINVYAVSGAARKAGVKVVLSGAGGDELFLGYKFFQSIDRVEKLRQASSYLPSSLWKSLIKVGIAAGQTIGMRSIEKLEYLSDPSDADAYLLFRGLFSLREIQELLGLSDREMAGSNTVNQAIGIPAQKGLLNNISLMDFKHYLGNQLLKDCDFMSMAHSLETRLPFLDHLLVEEVLKIPASVRLAKGKVPKPLLLAALGDDLPREVWDRPKMGFILPFDRWMRADSGELEARCQSNTLLDRKAVDKIWSRFKGGKIHWSRPWALVVLAHWLARRKPSLR